MHLGIHPLCELFPVMDPEELQELADDIKSNGQLEPIVTLNGQILDGRNRYLACKKAGIEPETVEFNFAEYNRTPEEYIWSMNVERRHLKADQKRDLIAKLLKADPTKSNRQIATEAKVDHKTAGAVRTKLEASGEIPHVPKTTDTKGRRQPAKKPKAKPDETGEKVLTLSSRLEDLQTKWYNEGMQDVWFRVNDDWEFSVRRYRGQPETDAGARRKPQ